MKNKIRELHGVNNGPGVNFFSQDMRIELFKEAGIPYSRLHDTEGIYGSGEFVNIHCIFPDFDADVNDPASYNFTMTDVYLENIVKAGTKIFYRLGETIENEARTYPNRRKYTFVPKDFKKWAEICEHIVMHYNEGWADGYHFGIEYWEIWNEPDEEYGPMWAGSFNEYYEMYRIVANHLKSRFPNIKIGGYGASGNGYEGIEREEGDGKSQRRQFEVFKNFISYITAPETKAPIDFFSWHAYIRDLAGFKKGMLNVRNYLDSVGLVNVESILDEWNVAGYKINGEWINSSFRKNAQSASFVAASLALMQKNRVDLGMYYDAEQRRASYNGLFDAHDSTPQKSYFAIKAYNELYKLGEEYDFDLSDGDGLYSLGAIGEERMALLISNFEGPKHRVYLDPEKLKGSKIAEIYLLDETHDLELVEKVHISKFGFELSVETDSVILVKFK